MSNGVPKMSKNGKNGSSAPERDSERTMNLAEPSAPELDSEGTVNLAVPPDGGWGWMVVFASFFVHIITDGMTYSFGVFYKEFLDYFDESKSKTAWIVSILVGVTLSSGSSPAAECYSSIL